MQQLKIQLSNTDTKVENLAAAHAAFRFESETSNFRQILTLNNIILPIPNAEAADQTKTIVENNDHVKQAMVRRSKIHKNIFSIFF
jgi:hypothetical protein